MNAVFDALDWGLRKAAVLILRKHLFVKFLRLLLVPPAFLVVLVARALYPRKVVRFGEIWTPRLGHLVGNTESYLCERDAGMHKAIDFWVPVPGPVSNKVVMRKYAKRLHLIPRWFGSVIFAVNGLFSDWSRHVVQPQQVDRDVLNLWGKYAPHIGFTEKEEQEGEALLRALGIPEGAKWVCLIVRDSAYLKQFGAGFAYHDYRDADVDDYALAALALADRGYYVVRMGSVVAKPFNVKSNKVIDYATSGRRSEFGDLYLGAKCAFCLGTPCGFIAIPMAFNRPLAVTDFAPLEYAPTFCRGLMIWKHHLKNGIRMTPSEIYACGAGQFTFAHLFEKEGITLQNNTPEEIRDLALQMCEEIEYPFVQFSYPSLSNFWKNFPRAISPFNNKPLHGEIVLRIGREFLKQYG